MPASKARIKANAKYTAKAYDKFLTYVHKGKKEVLQAHAAAMGESLNGFVNRAINEAMERDCPNAQQPMESIIAKESQETQPE